VRPIRRRSSLARRIPADPFYDSSSAIAEIMMMIALSKGRQDRNWVPVRSNHRAPEENVGTTGEAIGRPDQDRVEFVAIGVH
jgi:hypothetical protein